MVSNAASASRGACLYAAVLGCEWDSCVSDDVVEIGRSHQVVVVW